MKPIWCNSFTETYATSAMRCAKCAVAVLKAFMLDWGCQSAMGICALCYIRNLFGIMVLQRSMLNWIWGVNLPWVYVHCAIYETYLV